MTLDVRLNGLIRLTPTFRLTLIITLPRGLVLCHFQYQTQFKVM